MCVHKCVCKVDMARLQFSNLFLKQSFPLSLELTNWLDWMGSTVLDGIPISAFQHWMCGTTHICLCRCGSNTGPHACPASTLTTKPSL